MPDYWVPTAPIAVEVRLTAKTIRLIHQRLVAGETVADWIAAAVLYSLINRPPTPKPKGDEK